MKVGFIGLGKMGAGICSNIVKNGIDVVVYDINPANMQKFVDMGASSAATVKELAAQVDVCITCVPMPKDAKGVLLGPDGVFENLPEGGVHFDLSTLDIETVVMLEAEAAKLGKKYLVIPMGKGPAFAADGTCPLFTCKVDQQAGERQYLDAVQIAEGLAGQRHARVRLHAAEQLVRDTRGLERIGAAAEQPRAHGAAAAVNDERVRAAAFADKLTAAAFGVAPENDLRGNAVFKVLHDESFLPVYLCRILRQMGRAAYRAADRADDGDGPLRSACPP